MTSAPETGFTVGSLVRARGREWVVLPGSAPDVLLLRPLGGKELENTGLLTALEPVTSAQFSLPDPTQVGDDRSSRLLRDAIRLGLRSNAGPFRSFGHLGFEPRPYQIVPLLMALKLDPIRLLIADSVGIGKSIEAGMVARELLDRGEIERMTVLCPPPLAEQWQRELRDKFHIDAELVLPGTAARLERGLSLGQSLFEVHPFTVVSLDFIKSDRHREEFLRTCPELVIVDEAHTCAFAAERGGRHQRYELLRRLAENRERHLLLVTATPHSGKEDAFRSLLAFLSPEFANLPEDLSGEDKAVQRRRLAAHFIQRRRADIRQYLGAETPFPEREDSEETYRLTLEYKLLFERALAYARESVSGEDDPTPRQRVRWWSALSLLRSLASSPAAAAATLRARSATAEAETIAEVDEIGSRAVLDLVNDELAEDVTPGSDPGNTVVDEERTRDRLLAMARVADTLYGTPDAKLQKAFTIVRRFLQDGFHPIVFCRFIATAEYVAAALREVLAGDVAVAAVTGQLPPTEREARVLALSQSEKRVLVCTDCLSEGINLQDSFDAVLHYDLSWNPTRHEQREGRVDRYGQRSPRVRVLTYFGPDTQIDGIVLDVLLRKNRMIRNSLGVAIPIPKDANQVVEAIFEGLLLRETGGLNAQTLPGFEAYIRPQKQALFDEWDRIYEREKRSHTVFAHEQIKVDEVASELQSARAAIGSGTDVARFTREALAASGAILRGTDPLQVDLGETPAGLRDAIGQAGAFAARFDLPVQRDQLLLTRTHPLVEGLAAHVMETALDPLGHGVARRAGAIRTASVERRTVLLLVRYRFHLIIRRGDIERPLLAEECRTLAFAGPPQQAEWLEPEATERLLTAVPGANIFPEQASEFVRRVEEAFDALWPHLEQVAQARAQELLAAHQRVRQAAHLTGFRYRVEPHLPPDILGIYIYLPARGGA